MIAVVLVEDNREIRENTAELLELSNYKVSTAENGLIGLELIKKIQPEIVICDIMMPVMNGYEVLKSLKDNLMTKDIPFIYFTAKSESMDMEKGMQLGADAYLIKPFDDIELLTTINSVLEKRKTDNQK